MKAFGVEPWKGWRAVCVAWLVVALLKIFHLVVFDWPPTLEVFTGLFMAVAVAFEAWVLMDMAKAEARDGECIEALDKRLKAAEAVCLAAEDMLAEREAYPGEKPSFGRLTTAHAAWSAIVAEETHEQPPAE